MQILCDLDTETLAGLRNALYLIEQTIDARGGFIRDDEMPPSAQMVCGVPCVLASDVPTGTTETPPAGLGFGEPSVTSIQIANGNGTVDNSAPPALLTTQSIASPATIVPAAPSASVPAAAPPAALTPNSLTVALAAELDSAGLPWDARIHSDTHKKNADGSWRFRRNLDEAVKVTVLMELKPISSVPLPPADVPAPVPNVPTPPGPNVPPVRVDVVTPMVPLPPAQPAGGDVTAPGGATGANVVPQPPVTPPPGATGTAHVPVPATPPVGMPDPAKPVLLSDLIAKINKGFGAKTLTMVEVTAACEAEGLAGITALGHHPGKVQAVINRLKL